MNYIPTIGLEVHAELKTATKMFCACLNDSDETRPNINVCPVCMAHPGSLPVINKEAVRKVLLVGSAVGGALAERAVFDRKNYFYPDIPKGYQISQYKDPLVSGGALSGVKLTRVHLEEDTARSQHEGEKSLVDFNRAGVPLMELVTEPVVPSAEDAGRFARELQLLLRTLGAGEANMEKGEMRVEANISVAPEGSETFGTKVEVKNLNSFRSVERAIRFEIERQSSLLAKGERVVQETRGWDEEKQATYSQRKKESSHDYRYFPEPDLPELHISEIPEFSSDTLCAGLPELPWQKRERYLTLGLKVEEAEMYIRNEGFDVTGEIKMSGIGSFFEECLELCEGDKELIHLVSNYLSSDLPGLVKKIRSEIPLSTLKLRVAFPDSKHFVELVRMFRDKEINSRTTKDVLESIMKEDDDPRKIIKEKGLSQKSDAGALEEIARKIVKANPSVAADYKAGKAAAMQFLVGQGMKETKGSANPTVLREALEKMIG